MRDGFPVAPRHPRSARARVRGAAARWRGVRPPTPFMAKEIIINVTGEHSRIAIVEDGELVELYIENPENVRTIGDIYLGRVRRILPGIKAAFVDIGQKQDAFLHFSDLSDNLPDLLELSDGKVADHLRKHLAKAPKQPEDGSDSGLELETPQEQRAARRRRDLKRTHGRSRRGRKQDDAAPDQPAEQPEPQADAQAEQPETKKTGARKPEPRSTRAGRGSKKKQEAPERDPAEPDAAQETPDAAQEPTEPRAEPTRRRPAAPPQPPVSNAVPASPPPILPPAAVEPLQPEGAGHPESAEASEAPSDQPPKRSRRRGGKGRGRSRAAEPQPDARADEPERPSAEAPSPPEKPKRSRSGRPAHSKKADAPLDADRTPTGEPEAEKADAVPEKPEPRPPAKKAEPAKPARPARASRFVIDLTSKSGTSKPGRVDPDDREEEEEEEEKSSRSRRSSGRRRGGRRRGSADRSGSSDADDKKDDKKDDAKNGKGGRSRSGRSRSGRSRSKGGASSASSGGNGKPGGNGSSGPRPETYLRQDQKLIVKITKEPISSKGPRVSTDVSLAGRFLVLIPLADYVAVSKKIESAKERRRLRALARSLLPEGFGLIVRTVAENRDAKALDTDLRLLLQKWHKIEDQLRKKPNPPVALYEDVNMVSSIIRDLFSEDYDRIVVDDPKVHRNVKNYVQAVAPQMAENVTLHKGKDHVFRTYKIDGEVRAAFETRVPLPGGGYLFIEHTEAMHVIDVNSGRAGRGLSQEENALRVNLESARMIAKQLRLRDLGGIIVVDFIDMRGDSARKKVYDELKKEFRKDRAVTKLLPMSDFGVVQITRQRLRPSITTTTNVEDLPQAEEEPEVAEVAAPAATVPPAEAAAPAGPPPTAAEVVERLERWLLTYRDEVQDQHRKRPILVRLHPFLAAYLQRGIPSTLTRWKFKTRLNFRLDVDEHADPLAFSVRDEKSGKNLTKKYERDEGAAA